MGMSRLGSTPCENTIPLDQPQVMPMRRLREADLAVGKGMWQLPAITVRSLKRPSSDVGHVQMPASKLPLIVEANPLLGTWKLQAYVVTTAAGERPTPYEENPTGYLITQPMAECR